MERMGSRSRVVRFCFLLGLLVLAFPMSGLAGVRDQREVKRRLSAIGLPFIENQGQSHPLVAFYARTFAGTAYITRDGLVVYSLPQAMPEKGLTPPSSTDRSWVITERFFEGKTTSPKGKDLSTTGISSYQGNAPSPGQSHVPAWESVTLGEVWPGIEVILRAHGKNVEKIFAVQPGADPKAIRVAVDGATHLRVDEEGALVLSTGLGEVVFSQPFVYQDQEGQRIPVKGEYVLAGPGYGFRLGHYDPRLPLIIDPIVRATYLGWLEVEEARDIAIHPLSDKVYVTGLTGSPEFPGIKGGAQETYGWGTADAFVARLSPDLETLEQCTYLGGNGGEIGYAIAIHPRSGEVYVAGSTDSSNLPNTKGGAQENSGGITDAFIACLNQDLTLLQGVSYLGGTDTDYGISVAIHPVSGEIFVAGSTVSTNFPKTTGGAQENKAGGTDFFVARFSQDLATLHQTSYFGGTSYESNYAMAIHPLSGEVYLVGFTDSPDLPKTTGGAQEKLGGYVDAFIVRFSQDLTLAHQATYLGGTHAAKGRAVAIHPVSGDVYVAGYTDSVDFPKTKGGAQEMNAGGTEGFIVRLSQDLKTCLQATYLGGTGEDYIEAVAVHPFSREIYVAGSTTSTNFPKTSGGAQAVNVGGWDAFVARFSPDLKLLYQSTCLGGDSWEYGYAVAIHPSSGQVYVAGSTSSNSFPKTSEGAQYINAGSCDAFVVFLTPSLLLQDQQGIPTLTGHGLALLAGLVLLGGFVLLRKPKTK